MVRTPDDRHPGIYLPNGFAQRRGEGRGLAARGDDQRADRAWILSLSQIHHRRGRLADEVVFSVGSDPDDFDPRLADATGELNALPDGVLSGPVSRRQCLVNHRDARRVCGVGRCDAAAGNDRHVHRGQIALIDPRGEHAHALRAGRQLVAFGHDCRRLPIVLVQRHDRGHPDGRDSGKGQCALLELLVESLRLRLVIAGESRLVVRQEESIGPEPRVTELPLERASRGRR